MPDGISIRIFFVFEINVVMNVHAGYEYDISNSCSDHRYIIYELDLNIKYKIYNKYKPTFEKFNQLIRKQIFFLFKKKQI